MRPGRRARRFACAVAFLDPPYRSGLAAPALTALAAAGWLAPRRARRRRDRGATRHSRRRPGFALIDERVYGAARLVFLRRDGRIAMSDDHAA